MIALFQHIMNMSGLLRRWRDGKAHGHLTGQHRIRNFLCDAQLGAVLRW